LERFFIGSPSSRVKRKKHLGFEQVKQMGNSNIWSWGIRQQPIVDQRRMKMFPSLTNILGQDDPLSEIVSIAIHNWMCLPLWWMWPNIIPFWNFRTRHWWPPNSLLHLHTKEAYLLLSFRSFLSDRPPISRNQTHMLGVFSRLGTSLCNWSLK
jgi:hypothetical protein